MCVSFANITKAAPAKEGRLFCIWGISHAEADEAERQGREEVLTPKEREQWGGDQWTPAQIAAMSKLPPLTINTMPKPEAAKAPPGG